MLDIKELERIHMRASVAGDMLVSIAALGNAIDIMNQQQAEIERLRAALEIIASGETYEPFGGKTGNYTYTGLQGIAKQALQQQPEPSQEPLKVRILRYLAACDEVRSYNQISCETSPDKGFLELYLELSKEGLTERYANGSVITQAGRDYLASLDKPTIEMAGRKVRVLRYMEEQTLVRPSIYALQRLFGNDVKETMIELRNDGLVWEYPSKHNTYCEYVLTPQGMDYLASREPEALQRATDVFVECPQCRQQTLNLVHEFCSECDYVKAE